MLTHSITTLNPKKHKKIYGIELKNEALDAVGIYEGLERYQVNCPVTKLNVDELDEIIDFAHSKGAYVHLMELIGHEDNKNFYKENFISLEPIKAKLYEKCYQYFYSRVDICHYYGSVAKISKLR
ncbi:hypothetical protein KFD70_28380 [Bacillus pfraonensis]|uniref:hypothetical protein n=1 Tax=Bacillus TaxID=1386 RepID=UPI002A4E365F|nr:hypothetical protein [Bacillus pseudomycoides]